MFLRARFEMGLSPSEFWDMTLPEFLVEAAHRDYHRNDPTLAGSLSRADLDELEALLDD